MPFNRLFLESFGAFKSHRIAKTTASFVLLSLLSPINTVAPAQAASVSNSSGTANACSDTVQSTTGVTSALVSGKCVLTFTSGTNQWTVPANGTNFQTFVLGGGGGGSIDAGGGGGGGGAYSATLAVTAGTIVSTSVGGRGVPGVHTAAGGLTSGTASSGGNSTLVMNGLTIQGSGGAGGTYNGASTAAGGTGGAGTTSGTLSAGTISSTTASTGGTGGAGYGLGVSRSGAGLNGGNGFTSDLATGSVVQYGGGGGGGQNNSLDTIFVGGSGVFGGGNGGGAFDIGCSTAGAANRGGGGGGGRSHGAITAMSASNCSDVDAFGSPGNFARNGAYGGSGVIIISYSLPVINAPSNLVATTSSDASKIVLTWTAPTVTAPEAAANYFIIKSTDNFATSSTINTGSTLTTYEDTSVSANTQYFYRVYAVGTVVGTASANSNIARPSTFAVCVPVTSTITVSGISRTVVEFKTTGNCRWNAPAPLANAAADYLVVGGGASGTRGLHNTFWGAGGGGGAVLTGTSTLSGTITITVGKGGDGKAEQSVNQNSAHTGASGDSSRLGVTIATAAGGLGAVSGSGSDTTLVSGNAIGKIGGTSGNGNLGGVGRASNTPTTPACNTNQLCETGGGGGAGGAGGLVGGDKRSGGVGVLSSITGAFIEYGSGGAGRSSAVPAFGVASGGGGDGENVGLGQANTGSGGSDLPSMLGYGGGGSGIVVISYAGAPTVTSVSPSNGATAGGSIVITGTNFAAGATAAIGSTALTSVVIASSTRITATIPAMSAGTYNVTVTSGGQTATLTNGYTARSAVNVNFSELNFNYPNNHTNFPAGGGPGADCTSTETAACTGKLAGDKVLFKNVFTKDGNVIDAVVTTEAVSAGAVIRLYEVGTKAGGEESFFETDIRITTAGASVTFKFEFYYANPGYNNANPNLNRAVLENVNVTGIDIDYGQFNHFSGIESYTRDSATRLTISTTVTNPVITRFQGSNTIGANDLKDQVVTNYASFDTFSIVLGSTIANSSANALFGVAFKALSWGSGTPVTTGGTSYTLAYDRNGNASGSVPANQSGLVGQNMTVASNTGPLVRSGFTFNGWNTVADGSGTAYAANSRFPMPKDGSTLFAQWVGIPYTLSYSANNGSGAPSSQTSNAGLTVSVSATQPTRSGFNFTGWNDVVGGTGNAYASGGTLTMPASNITLHAQWSQITYTIAYDANGGSGAPSSQTGTLGSAQTVSSTAPTWTGYTFGGWNTSAAGTGTAYAAGSSVSMPVGGLTLYAKWTAITNFLLTYNANGGSGAPSPETRGASEVFNLSATTPTRSGFTFAGWDAAANGTGTDYTANGSFTMAGANVSIFAKWTANTITVTYNGNTSDGSVPTVQSGSFGETVTASALGNLVKTGYTFNGWNTAAAGTGNSFLAGSTITLPVANVILYAQWSANSYTISYNANGGTNAPTSHSASTDSSVTAKAIGSMTRTGYTFAGWDGAADGSGTDYAAGGTFTMPGNNLTLFAKWTVIPISINYVLGTAGGTAVTGPTLPATVSVNFSDTHTVGSLSSETITVSSQIYGFAGWTTGSNTYRPGSSITAGTANITMTATWVELFRVKYLPNGGTPTSSTEDSECLSGLCTNNAPITLDASTVFSRTGYTFAKWTSQAGTDYDAGASRNVSTTDYLFYAKWTANPYVLSYNKNGSDQTAPINQNQTTDSVATVASAITWAGYVFTGWNTAANGSGTSYAVGRTFTMPAQNVELFAQWSALSYSVIYNANGGSNPPAVQSQATGSNVTVAGVSSMSRTGYTFAGWNTNADGTSGTDRAAADTFTMAASNITLFAKWSINSYTVSYNVNSGAGGPAASQTGNTSSTVTVSNTDPTRTGYIFTGWNTACDGTGTSYVSGATFAMPVGGATLCAQWAPIISYIITYFANGGTSAPSAQAEAQGATATASSAGSMSRSGHVFTGWNTAANGTGTAQAVASTFTMPGANVELHAQWSISAYTLSYDVNGGSGSVAAQSANSGATVILNSTAPSRTGYGFVSWTTVADGSGTSYTPGASVTISASNIVLYAQWSINSFTLTYDANSGASAPSASSVAFNASVTTAAIGSLTRNGYTFIGWNSAANGSGTNYIAGTTTFNMPASNVTLFAQWAPASFLLSYNANSGSGAPSVQGALVDSSVTVSATVPTRSGHTFAGWNANADGTGTAYASSSTFVMPPNNLTIFAQWTAITYTLTYFGNGNSAGSAPTAQTGIVGATVATSAAGTLLNAGYTFTGWNTAANYSGTGYAVGRDYTFTAANVTLYAHWVADIYKLIYNANGGLTPPAAIEVATNASITVPVAGTMVRPGYTFAGWTTNADGTGTVHINGTGTSSFTMPGAITTLFANWTANNYDIVYFANTGSGTVPGTQTDSVTALVSVQEPTLLSKTNSVFTSWNTAADGTGISYSSLAAIPMPVGGLNLYAQWSGIAFTIAYNANGGSSAPTPQTGIAGRPVTLASLEPVRPQNTFALWSIAPTGGSTTFSKGGVLTMPSNDLVLFAQWSAVVVAEPTPQPAPVSPGVSVFVITYDSNTATSGQVPIDIKRYVTGEIVTVLTNSGSLARTGFTFAGWNTKADGTGTPLSVDPTARFTMLPNNIVLYAQWIAAGKYTLTYNANGATSGTVPTETENLIEGGRFTVKTNSGTLIRTGFIFEGWNTKADGTGTQHAPSSILIVGKTNITLFAQWKALSTFAITFNGNSPTSGTAPVDAKKYLEGEIAIIPMNSGNLIKTGFTFVGWNTKADGSGVSYPAGGAFKVGSANLLLYAMWIKNVAPTPTVKNGRLNFEVFYAMNSIFLDAKNRKVINSRMATVKKRLNRNSRVTISIVGWVQPTRVSPNIQFLSTNRAQVVARYMRNAGFKGVYILRFPGHDEKNIPSSRSATVSITWTNSK